MRFGCFCLACGERYTKKENHTQLTTLRYDEARRHSVFIRNRVDSAGSRYRAHAKVLCVPSKTCCCCAVFASSHYTLSYILGAVPGFRSSSGNKCAPRYPHEHCMSVENAQMSYFPLSHAETLTFPLLTTLRTTRFHTPPTNSLYILTQSYIHGFLFLSRWAHTHIR